MKVKDLITKLQIENQEAYILLAIGFTEEEKTNVSKILNTNHPVFMREDKIEVLSPARPTTNEAIVIIGANYP